MLWPGGSDALQAEGFSGCWLSSQSPIICVVSALLPRQRAGLDTWPPRHTNSMGFRPRAAGTTPQLPTLLALSTQSRHRPRALRPCGPLNPARRQTATTEPPRHPSPTPRPATGPGPDRNPPLRGREARIPSWKSAAVFRGNAQRAPGQPPRGVEQARLHVQQLTCGLGVCFVLMRVTRVGQCVGNRIRERKSPATTAKMWGLFLSISIPGYTPPRRVYRCGK